MSILSELTALLDTVGIPSETGGFNNVPPDAYTVVTPLSDTFALHADDRPRFETQEARLSLYSRNNYTALKNRLVKALLGADFTVTDRRYIGFETDTKYHHYNVDTAKEYEVPDETGELL